MALGDGGAQTELGFLVTQILEDCGGPLMPSTGKPGVLLLLGMNPCKGVHLSLTFGPTLMRREFRDERE